MADLLLDSSTKGSASNPLELNELIEKIRHGTFTPPISDSGSSTEDVQQVSNDSLCKIPAQ